MSSELVDVVDEHGRVTGTATRAQMRAGNLRHRSVGIVVRRPDGRALVAHRRADWKDVWPGYWDLAFGGVVASGEDWGAAAHRELAAETGIGGRLLFLGEGSFEDDHVRDVARIYRIDHAGPFSFADSEVVEMQWLDLDALETWLAEPDRRMCPDTAAIVLPLLRRPQL